MSMEWSDSGVHDLRCCPREAGLVTAALSGKSGCAVHNTGSITIIDQKAKNKFMETIKLDETLFL